MKGILCIAAIACGLPVVADAQNDIYYIPSKEVKEVTVDEDAPSTHYQEDRTARYYQSNRDVDEYNRRGQSSGVTQDDTIQSETVDEVDSNMDEYAYSKRIMRFHSPVVGVIVSSPYYWDICYADPWDTYYDGWAVALPSWSYWTYAYDPWYYNRWWYRTCWDYTWGWYDPWWGSFYWGWGHPAYWGWNRPYYGGWAGHWGGCHFYDGWAPGFGHPAGGGRFAGNDVASVRTGSAGGFIRQGGFGRSNVTNGSSVTPSRSFIGGRGLDKSFRTGGFGTGSVKNSTAASGRISTGGGFSRSNVRGGTFSRGESFSRGNLPTYSRSGRSYTPNSSYQSSDSRTYNPQKETQTRSYSPSTSSRSGGFSNGGSFGRSGGSFSSGGGFSRGGGGGGFSRGGGGGRR